MKSYLVVLCVAGLVWTARPASVDAATEGVVVDSYAALVNQRVITVGEVFVLLQPVERELRTRFTGAELRRRIEAEYERALDVLIEHALILEDFASLEGHIPGQYVDDHINELIREQFKGDRQAFVRAMMEDGLSMEEFRDQIRERITVMIRRRQQITPRVALSPRTVREVYEARIDEYREPPRYHVRMITVNREEEAAARERADRAREQALSGEDFAALARIYSQDSRAAQGGEWGWVEADMFRDEVQSALINMEPGAVSEIIETPDSYHILKLEAYSEARVTPLVKVQQEIEHELRRAEEQRRYRLWIEQLQSRFYVNRFPPPGNA